MSKRAIVSVTLMFLAAVLILSSQSWASCTAPANAIEAENCITTGSTPQSVWDVGTPPNSGSGDSTIQGFGDNISVNVGDTINFKVKTTATSFHLDIYRMGYYQGNGARKITTITGTPRTQPNCLTNSGTGLYDCGNWQVSASWTVPTTAVSGIYFARAVRDDTGGASHIMFIVRNDASHSDILFQATDTSWQAYNDFGGQNFYGCGGWDLTCRSFKNSYNRPFHTRDFEGESVTFVFGNEYPMIRWLEANGYDVTYFTDTDTDRNGSLILNHKLWMSNGHDEYWSGTQRANIEAARNAGVHLAFFSGNTMFWKVRWENSTDGSNTPYRTLVCYKETAGDVTDPLDKSPTWTWTGTWRDPTNSPPADAGRPENAIKGNLFRMNGGQSATMQVPSADGKMRFWRNTTVATASGTTNLATGTVGAEFDDDEDNGFRPAGLFELTATSVTDSGNYLLDYGVTYGSGTAINKLVMYRHTSGAIVFSTGTYRWSWGLDNHHDDTNEGSNTNLPMQQATVNLFADMGIQPVTLQSGLLLATQSTDHTPPNSTITSPAQGATIGSGTKVTIQGTAADTGGGVIAGVEVSTDGGSTWHPASGRTPWTYTWSASGNSTVTLKSRAVDDSGNLESPSAGVTVTVGSGGGGGQSCPCTIFGAATPSLSDEGADSPSEIGVRFKSDVAGQITGIRFYKSAANTGTHVGNLWNSSGTNLATGTFANETASGWQTLTFATPVSITAGTYYVASYFNTVGHYAEDDNFFTAAYDNAPLHAAQDGVPAADGVYIYSSTSAFPNQTWQSANYYVDVVFTTTAATVDVSSVTVNPTSVSGGSSSSGTVTLNAPAGSSGMVVSLSSDNAAASPSVSSVTVASGQTTGTFLINTQVVSSVTTAHISAKDSNNVTVQATLTVTPPPALSSVTINPTTVVGGNGSTGTVTLTEPATVPGIQVNLSSDSASAQVGANVVVPTGATTATFPITTSQVSTGTTAHISGTYNNVTPTPATLTINPLTVNSVSLSPTAVIGGNSSTGTVTLSGPTPSAISVTLGSTAGATVPASVTINANASSATFTATTTGVSSATTSTITATYGTSSAQAVLTINPLTVSSVSVNPTAVVGPNSSTGTVTLSGPAPTATSVSLGSNSGSASVGASVTVAANASTATFPITTVAVSTLTPATITATLGSSSAQAVLTVNPPALASVSMNPTSVVGGNPSTGTVTLTGPAPSTGLTVTLGSTTGATVPTSVNVAANATTATFSATTTAVTTTTTSTITASYNGVNQTATLTVTPKASLAIDKTVFKDNNSASKTIKTAAFTTSAANELLLAFISTDGPSSGTNTTVTGISGGPTWTLVKRTNTQRGTAEVWRAFSTTVLTNTTVTATLSSSQGGSMTIVTFTGASTTGTGIGATGTGNSAKGAPTASLTTTVANSWVFGVGNDWDNATARTVPSNQTMVHQDVATSSGDTYWVQRMAAVTPTAGTVVTINDTAPTGDKFNLSLVEVLPSN